MSGIRRMNEPSCYDDDFKRRVMVLFPDDRDIHAALENGDENVSFSLRQKSSLDGTFVKQCLDDPERLEELKTAAHDAATARNLLNEWGDKYRHIFWEY